MFTFKTTKPVGSKIWKMGKPDSHKIKLKKKVVGCIEDETWGIYFSVIKKDIMEDGNPNCKWKNIKLKKKSSSLQKAKDFVNKYFKEITENYNLYQHED
jgi:hypothetical protein